MITRRSFLKAATATAAGLVLPDWVIKAENFIEIEGEPLLEIPRQFDRTLYAVDWGGDEYQLTLGNPYTEAPPITWREYFEYYGYEGFHDYYRSNNPADWAYLDIDNYMPEPSDMDYWIRRESPSARAFDYLEGKDLGPALSGPTSKGEIKFYDGVALGNDSKVVAVPDDLSLSLLQKRLNDIDGSIKVALEHDSLSEEARLAAQVAEEEISRLELDSVTRQMRVGLRSQAGCDLEESYLGTGSDYKIRS